MIDLQLFGRQFTEKLIALPESFHVWVLGFAVPTSNSRYIATESQLTISPRNSSANFRESAVFPLPVGPRITTSSGSGGAAFPCSRSTFSAGSNESRASSG